MLAGLEPWCSTIYINSDIIESYIEIEKANTNMNLHKRIKSIDNEKNNNILVEIDTNKFSEQDYNYVQQLSKKIESDENLKDELIHFSDDPEFELGNLKIVINSLKTFEEKLIKNG